jgi:hypothetical protein
MGINTDGGISGRVRRMAMAIIASGIMIAPAVHATHSNSIVLVSPTNLPELARQPGDAMFLRDANDGRAILYVEQNHGGQLSVFDVTDPSHVRSEGSMPLGTAGPFDFVSPLGSQKELVRFRQDRGEAVLDFHKVWLPSLKRLPAIDSRGSVSSQPMHDYQAIGTSSLRDPIPVFEVKQVRDELTKQDTDTTFLLTEAGLYLIRRPIAESDKRRRDEKWFWQHTGG